MADKDIIGWLIGAGIITASGIAAGAAIYGSKKGKDLLDYDIIPSDEEWEIFRDIEGENVVVNTAPGIWFETPAEYWKYVYDNIRQWGLPVRGAFLALGHAQKAGNHAIGKRLPLIGFNIWGMRASAEYRKLGKPYYLTAGGSKRWRYYNSIDDAVKDWLKKMRKNYPISYAEMMSRDGDIDEYVYGLFHGRPFPDGRPRIYGPGVENFPEVIEWVFDNVPEILNEDYGYNIDLGG